MSIVEPMEVSTTSAETLQVLEQQLTIPSLEVAEVSQQMSTIPSTETTLISESSFIIPRKNVADDGTNVLENHNISDESVTHEKVNETIPELPVNNTSTNNSERLPVESEKNNYEKVIDTDLCETNTQVVETSTEVSDITTDTTDCVESPRFFYDWSNTPHLLCFATEEYTPTESNENFTKGCQWSPDGTCLLVPSEDFRIRIYELPRELYTGKIPEKLPLENFKPALSVREGGLVYDSCWYPRMNSWDPATCCFLSTSRESPLHLWDAFTGELRATYRPYNQVDEVEAAISAQFIDDGREVWCGFKGALRSFDTDRPGRQKDTISFKTDFPNVNGLVSCIRENPIMPGLIAFGTYSKCVGLWKDGPLCSLKTDSGITQIEFSPCGTKLYTAVRRSNEFLCWDLRNPGVVLYSLRNREANTNQRIQFALSNDASEIISGGTDGFISVWRPPESPKDEEEIEPLSRIRLSKDCINGVSVHKSLPILATSSGQRICDGDDKCRDNSVRLWFCQNGN